MKRKNRPGILYYILPYLRLEFTKEDLVEFRECFRLSQVELGNWLGVSKSTLSDWERGARAMSKMDQLCFNLLRDRVTERGRETPHDSPSV